MKKRIEDRTREGVVKARRLGSLAVKTGKLMV